MMGCTIFHSWRRVSDLKGPKANPDWEKGLSQLGKGGFSYAGYPYWGMGWVFVTKLGVLGWMGDSAFPWFILHMVPPYTNGFNLSDLFPVLPATSGHWRCHS